MDDTLTIYHNPACGTSRNTLALLQQAGLAPKVIEYLVTPLPREVIAGLAERIGLPLRDIMRRKGTPYAELALDDPGKADGDLLDAIARHPILLNRPIVSGAAGTRLCRPSDVVLDLLPQQPTRRILKEDGAPFLRDRLIPSDDPGLVAALTADGLPVDDLGEAGRLFYAHDTLDGERVGYGGFERHGENVLIRSIVVMPGMRRTGIGSSLVPLLLYRAFAQGARRAFLLTSSAAPFFAALGFKPQDRQDAPAGIRATRQATALCPASATLMSRKLGF